LYIPLRSDITSVLADLYEVSYRLYIPLRSDITDKFNNFTLFGVYALYPTTFRYNLYKFFKLWVFCFVLYIPLRSDITKMSNVLSLASSYFISHYVQI